MEARVKKAINIFADAAGTLSVLNFRSIPFIVKRMYWIDSVPSGHIRGRHAHKNLSQFFVVIKGTLEIELRTMNEQKVFLLSNDGCILIIGPGIWRELREFSQDAIVLVGTDEEFLETDYIRDWNEYLKWIKSK